MVPARSIPSIRLLLSRELVDVVQGLGLEAQNPIVFGIISSLDNSKGRELDFDDFKEILTGSFGDF